MSEGIRSAGDGSDPEGTDIVSHPRFAGSSPGAAAKWPAFDGLMWTSTGGGTVSTGPVGVADPGPTVTATAQPVALQDRALQERLDYVGRAHILKVWWAYRPQSRQPQAQGPSTSVTAGTRHGHLPTAPLAARRAGSDQGRIRQAYVAAILVSVLVASSCNSGTVTEQTSTTRAQTSAPPTATTSTTLPQQHGELVGIDVAGAASRVWLLGTVSCGNEQCVDVVRSDDDGHSWISEPTSTVPVIGIDRLLFASGADGYAYGVGASVVLWTNDGGQHWRTVTLPGPLASPLVVGGGRVYAAVKACSSPGCTSYRIASSPVTTNEWTVRTVPETLSQGDNLSLAAAGQRLWLITTSEGYGRAKLYLLNWSSGALTGVPTHGLQGISCVAAPVSPQVWWAVCNSIHSSTVFHSSDGGAAFVNYAAGFDYFPGSSLYPLSQTEAVLRYSYLYDTRSLRFGLEVTKDGGHSVHVILQRDDILGLSFLTNNVWLALGRAAGENVMWLTTTGGASWTEVPVKKSLGYAAECRSSQLRVSVVSLGGVAGTEAYTATFFNKSDAPCALFGYPTVVLRGAGGRVTESFRPHVNVMGLPDPPPPEMVLLGATVGKAQFRFGGADWIPQANGGKGGPCPSTAETFITPPGDSQALVVHQQFALCGGGVEAVTAFGWRP